MMANTSLKRFKCPYCGRYTLAWIVAGVYYEVKCRECGQKFISRPQQK